MQTKPPVIRVMLSNIQDILTSNDFIVSVNWTDSWKTSAERRNWPLNWYSIKQLIKPIDRITQLRHVADFTYQRRRLCDLV